MQPLITDLQSPSVVVEGGGWVEYTPQMLPFPPGKSPAIFRDSD